jgi:D-amino peptidase
MKILMMTDMEGVAGILNHADWVVAGARFYEKGMRLLTLEVNAAVDGLFAGGATEVVVVDGHGQGGIDPELLDARASLRRGGGPAGCRWGLDGSVAGLAFVGQHAKAGTDYSHITHTQGFSYIDVAINDVSFGEYGQLALCAMELGIPTILACGEEALAAEASALTPGVVTAAGKRGLLKDGLDHLDKEAYSRAKLSALHQSPAAARERIRAAAQEAAEKLRSSPGAFSYPPLRPPYVRTARFRKNGEVPAFASRDTHPDSLATLIEMPYSKI